MNRTHIFVLTLIFCVCFVGIVDILCANGITVKLTPMFPADKFPEGGNPANPDHTNTFTFNLTVDGLEANEYYKIEATLDSTNYKGTCANYESRKDRDLKFAKSDYPKKNKTGWTRKSDKLLICEIKSDDANRTAPGSITVRCYDYGAYGTLSVSVREKTGLLSGSDPVADTGTIPIDENGNQIADGWENDDQKTHEVDGELKGGYDPTTDDENVPVGTFALGDGWSVYDEYRGLFGWVNVNSKKVPASNACGQYASCLQQL